MVAGRHNPRLMPVEVAIRASFWTLEKAFASTKDLDLDPCDGRFCAIVDYTGFGLSNLDLPLTRSCIDIFQNNYPEMLGDVFLCNIPWVIKYSWPLVKPWLQQSLIEKVHFVTNTKELLKYFEPENIPVIFGGKSTWGILPCNSPASWEESTFSIGAETLELKTNDPQLE